MFAPGVRTGLVSMPRANGKTMLAAALTIAELWVGPPSAEALVVASDQRQANITLRYARRMIELNPVLAERCHIFADRLYVPETDSLLLPLPAEPGALHGHDPALLVVDELHVVTGDVWTAATSAAGKRPESLTLAISTPATTPDCVMWSLVEHGRAGDDPAFYFEEYGAPEGCTTDDREAWRIANPALACEDPFLAEDGIEAVRRTLREPVFRQLRLGQWVTGAESWMPWGVWADRASPMVIEWCSPSTGAPAVTARRSSETPPAENPRPPVIGLRQLHSGSDSDVLLPFRLGKTPLRQGSGKGYEPAPRVPSSEIVELIECQSVDLLMRC